MAVNLNHTTLSGNLTRDPALEVLASGNVVCELHVACHYRARDAQTGQWREHTDFIPVRAFAHQARTAHEHLRKGSGVAIVGRICSRKLSEGGVETWRVEVIAQAVQFLDPPGRVARETGRDTDRDTDRGTDGGSDRDTMPASGHGAR
jgi:single-strand DNA-binding protein